MVSTRPITTHSNSYTPHISQKKALRNSFVLQYRYIDIYTACLFISCWTSLCHTRRRSDLSLQQIQSQEYGGEGACRTSRVDLFRVRNRFWSPKSLEIASMRRRSENHLSRECGNWTMSLERPGSWESMRDSSCEANLCLKASRTRWIGRCATSGDCWRCQVVFALIIWRTDASCGHRLPHTPTCIDRQRARRRTVTASWGGSERSVSQWNPPDSSYSEDRDTKMPV